MKIVITGAAGFIGTHLSRELAEAGHHVVTTDRRGADLFGDVIQHKVDLLSNPGWEHGYVEGWREMPTCLALDRILKLHNPDVVVHLAAQVGRQFGEDAPAVAALDNVGMTALVARSCAEAGVRLCYASTSEVYGDVGGSVAHEDAHEVHPFATGWPARGLYDDLPHNVYGLTKRQAEEVAALYATHHGVNTEQTPVNPCGLQVIRPSMPYGPGLPPGRGRAAIVNFLEQARTGQPLTVHRGAERSWCWIGDCVRGIRLVLEAGEVAYTWAQWLDGRGCYNVGRDDDARSMEDVARLAMLTAHPGIRYGKTTDPDPIELVAAPGRQTIVKRLATDKLRGLGWEPTVTLEDGMRRTLAWLEAR